MNSTTTKKLDNFPTYLSRIYFSDLIKSNQLNSQFRLFKPIIKQKSPCVFFKNNKNCSHNIK